MRESRPDGTLAPALGGVDLELEAEVIAGPAGRILTAVRPALPPFGRAFVTVGDMPRSTLFPELTILFSAWSLAFFATCVAVFRLRDLTFTD